jgi:hypothetical protein
MSLEVITLFASLGVLVYLGLHMLSQPSDAIQRIDGWMRRLDELEAVLTRQRACLPIEIDDSQRTRIAIQVFGLACVGGALFRAAILLALL